MSHYKDDPETKETYEDTKTIRVRRHLWPEEVELIETRRKLKASRIIACAAAVVMLVMGWLLGSILPLASLRPVQQNISTLTPMDSSNKITSVLKVMENNWFFGQGIEDLDVRLTDQALRGITSNEEDPHTEYMSAEEVLEFTQSINRNFVGIGVQFLSDNGINMIEKVFRGSPAEKAGVLSGDIIHKIDGEIADGMNSDEIKERVMGDEGTDVTIEFLRQGEPVVITITRGQISATSFGTVLEDGIGYLELYQFGEGSGTEVKGYLDDFVEQGVSRLIIDLRDNGGGYLTALADIASFFVPKGTVVMKQEYADGQKTEIQAQGGMYTNFNGIVILVNNNTASASEVLTMALKEQRDDVTVIGTKTYGKGTVQITHSFNDGSALKYTTSKWISPNEVWVNGVGIEPDETVNLHDVLNRTFGGLEEGQILQKDQVSEAIKDVQLSLDYLGYAPGRTDGYFSEGTAAALSAFCQAYELSDNGTIDETIYKALFSAVRRDWSLSHTHDVQLHRAQEVLHG